MDELLTSASNDTHSRVPLGISPQSGWGYLRISNNLRALPTTTALFRSGKLSWSKIRLSEQFARQQHAIDISLFDFEKDLRNNRESFNRIRKLSPIRYRFRVVDAAGHDIRNRQSADADTCGSQYSVTHAHSTRVECRELKSGIYHSVMSAQYKVDDEDDTAGSGRSRGFG